MAGVGGSWEGQEKSDWMGGELCLLPSRHCNSNANVSQPYFNEILGAGNTKLASVFIPKCTTLPLGERIEMWLKCGMPRQAVEEARKMKDRNALEELRSKVDGDVQLEIDRVLELLRKGRY